MKPALDNSLVDTFFLYRTDGDWYVSFYDKDDKIISHNIELINSDNLYRESHQIYKWARVNAITKWGANRIVKKFLQGKIPDFKLKTRPLP